MQLLGLEALHDSHGFSPVSRDRQSACHVRRRYSLRIDMADARANLLPMGGRTRQALYQLVERIPPRLALLAFLERTPGKTRQTEAKEQRRPNQPRRPFISDVSFG